MLAACPFLKFDDDTTVLTEQFGECIWTVICFAENNEKQFYLYQSSSCSLASSARSHISFSSRLKSPAFSSSSQFIPFSSSPVVEIFDSSPSLSPSTSSSSSACFALTGFTDPVWFHCAFAMLFLKASWASLISDVASFSFPSG